MSLYEYAATSSFHYSFCWAPIPLGCYADSGDNRALPVRIGTKQPWSSYPMTMDLCAAAAYSMGYK